MASVKFAGVVKSKYESEITSKFRDMAEKGNSRRKLLYYSYKNLQPWVLFSIRMFQQDINIPNPHLVICAQRKYVCGIYKQKNLV